MASVETKKIGTHNGTFHCDEALACFLLRLTSQFSGAEVVRSRDPAVLDALPIIVDVGGVFDPAKFRFDHHQRGFEETFSPKHKIKLSSAGLIYKYFGKEIIQKLTGASDKNLDVLYLEMYHSFIEALDGIDNGVNQYPAELQPAYVNNTDLSSRVGNLNPAWNEEGVDLQARFLRAMEMTGTEFVDRLKYLANSWLPARDVVLQAIEKRHEIHPSGEIILLPRYTQWQGHLFDLEKELQLQPSVKYCLYQDQNGSWRVQAVAERSGSFNSRKALPEPWRGIRDDALSALTGIPGCIFVHASGFIGGNATRDGVLAMTVASLNWTPAAAEPEQKKQKV